MGFKKKVLTPAEKQKAIADIRQRIAYYEQCKGFPPSFPVSGVRALLEEYDACISRRQTSK